MIKRNDELLFEDMMADLGELLERRKKEQEELQSKLNVLIERQASVGIKPQRGEIEKIMQSVYDLQERLWRAANATELLGAFMEMDLLAGRWGH